MKEKENEKSSLSGKPYNLSARDLLDNMKMAEMVCDFYDNEMKANTGHYYGEETAAYDAAAEKFKKYLRVKEELLFEMEKRVKELC